MVYLSATGDLFDKLFIAIAMKINIIFYFSITYIYAPWSNEQQSVISNSIYFQDQRNKHSYLKIKCCTKNTQSLPNTSDFQLLIPKISLNLDTLRVEFLFHMWQMWFLFGQDGITLWCSTQCQYYITVIIITIFFNHLIV